MTDKQKYEKTKTKNGEQQEAGHSFKALFRPVIGTIAFVVGHNTIDSLYKSNYSPAVDRHSSCVRRPPNVMLFSVGNFSSFPSRSLLLHREYGQKKVMERLRSLARLRRRYSPSFFTHATLTHATLTHASLSLPITGEQRQWQYPGSLVPLAQYSR
eukprot:gene7330-5164_t